MEIKVTDVKIKKINSTMRAKAIASVVINNAIKINDIRVIDGKDGLFVAMPSRKTVDEQKFMDIVHPINKETRAIIEDAILDEYEKMLNEGE